MPKITLLRLFCALLAAKLATWEDEVPAWSVDGRRLRPYSREAADYLASLSFVSARRNRKGRILAIHFRDQDGGNALRVTAKMGQRYSVLERVDDVRVWKHKEITDLQASDFQGVTFAVTGEGTAN